ncbi:hypothetical protein Pla52n_02690 [Stieleria varia]|uniref:Uncharacterized protein n=1 Tax=Stieleria varia TaxID=2528005 RepID=A0A5C6B8V6_9BACT|nr:hypothetical protein Pla52n_02690 [Stieleria varia]
MWMIDFSANRFLTLSCDTVGKCRLFFITRCVSEGFTESPWTAQGLVLTLFFQSVFSFHASQSK